MTHIVADNIYRHRETGMVVCALPRVTSEVTSGTFSGVVLLPGIDDRWDRAGQRVRGLAAASFEPVRRIEAPQQNLFGGAA